MAGLREDYDINLRAQYSGQGAFGALRRDLSGVQGAIVALSGGLGGLGAGLGAAGIVAFAKDAVKSLGDIAETAERVGASTDALQTLQFELKQSGGQAFQAEQALTKFGDAVSSVGDDNNVLARLLRDNNVAFRDQNDNLRSTDALLEDYARLVANAASQQEKIALATEAFGRRAGPRMIAVLERIASEGLPAMIAKAKEAGQVADEALTKAADEIGDKWDAMIDRATLKLKSFAVTAIQSFGTASSAVGDAMKREADKASFSRTAKLAGHNTESDYASELARERMRGGFFGVGRSEADVESESTRERLRGRFPVLGKGKPTDTSALRKTGLEDERDRVQEVIDLLKVEGDQLTLNVEARRKAEQAEQEIIMLKRAGITADDEEAERIKGAVAALFEKKRAFDELKKAQEAFNDALRFGGDIIADSLDGLINKTKTWNDVLHDTLRMLQSAALKAAIMGEGPLAGIFGTKSKTGDVGGLLGALFGGFRAGGGDVMAGRAYVVGEKRPEIFVPSESGRIIPSIPGGSAPIIFSPSYHFDAGIGPADLAMIQTMLAASEARTRGDVVPLLRGVLQKDSDALN